MKRREFIGSLISAIWCAGVAEAEDFSDDIVRELKRNGYRVVSVSRTLLGRVRIRARKSNSEREIIVNPATGEILRDLWVAGGEGSAIEDRPSSGSGSGNDDDDADDDDDRDDSDDSDDDDDDDSGGNSGSGGGDDDDDNSGKGGGEDDDKEENKDDDD